MPVLASLALAAALTAAPSAAPADQSSPCKGPAAQPGQTVEGVVLHIASSDRLCVARTTDPSTWTELQLDPADRPAMASPQLGKAALMSVAFTHRASCIVKSSTAGEGPGSTRPLVRCRIDGSPLGALFSEPGALEKAILWLPKDRNDALPTLRVASR